MKCSICGYVHPALTTSCHPSSAVQPQASATSFTVPALPIDPEAERIVDGLVSSAQSAAVRKPLKPQPSAAADKELHRIVDGVSDDIPPELLDAGRDAVRDALGNRGSQSYREQEADTYGPVIARLLLAERQAGDERVKAAVERCARLAGYARGWTDE